MSTPTRSMGIKLLIVCALALLMTVPALFVSSLVQDRTQRATKVEQEIAAQVGGPQTFLGPTLVVPWRRPAAIAGALAEQGVWLVAPAHASGVVRTVTEERSRSLFRVPVFQADLKLDSRFDLTAAAQALPPGAQPDWSRAEIVVGASDARGALSDATIAIDGKPLTAVPAEVAPEMCFGANASKRPRLALLGIPAGTSASPGARFHVSATLRFSGARRLAVLAYGRTTQLEMQGDWPSPGFDGDFLPLRRNITSGGFQANWSVPFIARGVRAEGTCESVSALDATAFGVSFVEVADAWQSVSRSLKYAVLFVGLVFLTFFTFESTSGKRLHAAQYVLVGLAQMIFYVLLLSIAEHAGFDIAFLLAGGATVLLLAANVRWVFASLADGVRSFLVFSVLYSLMYLLLRLEDNALLIGSVASFLAVAAVMYATRNLDWYGLTGHQREPSSGLS